MTPTHITTVVTGDFLSQGYRLISGSGADFAGAVTVEEALMRAASTEAVLAEVSTVESPIREATADKRFVRS